MTHADLFSGIGGFSLAAYWAGFTTLAHCENAPFPRAVLAKNFPDVPICEEVHDFADWFVSRFGDRGVDLLTGGFPCQDLSDAGKGEGLSGDRSGLWFAMLAVVRRLQPRFVVAENVRGILSKPGMGGYGAIETVCAGLGAEGYEPQVFVLAANDVGAPHRRERVFIVAESLPDTDRKRKQQPQGRVGEVGGGAFDGGKDIGMAHTPCVKAESFAGQSRIAANRASGQELGDARRCGCTGQSRGRTGQESANGHGGSEVARQCRCAKPGMDRVPDGFPAGLDGNPGAFPFPAPPTQTGEQYPHEPPRLARNVPNREHRLHGLGNALVPQQVHPFLCAIAARLRAARF